MQQFREDFPIFKQRSDKPLIYFDNAATTHKPRAVISALVHFYNTYNAQVNRGLYDIAERATEAYEAVRYKVARFLNTKASSEIIFTKGTTDGINMVVACWAEHVIQAGDEIVVTQLEHHSNFVPWQQLAKRKNAQFTIIPVGDTGVLDLTTIERYITPKTKIVAVSHVSNALGHTNDLKTIIKQAKKVGARVLIDGAQMVPFGSVDVQALGVDFYVFSGHKMLAPTGIGILYISRAVQKACIPVVLGGGMIYEVDNGFTTYLAAPQCFEAGTPAIAEVIGLGAAIDYLFRIGFEEINTHVVMLNQRLLTGLSKLSKIAVLGNQEELKTSGHIVSFTVTGMHAHDVAAALNKQGICVRSGHHCAQPLAKRLGYDASIRVSFYLYNTIEEVDYFLKVLKQLVA